MKVYNEDRVGLCVYLLIHSVAVFNNYTRIKAKSCAALTTIKVL